MFLNKKILGLIPARGGSKGIPHKNLQEINGISLLGMTIQEAQKSSLLDYLILSSEEPRIIAEAKRYGCAAPFVRPESLATDEASSIDVILHALENVSGYDYLVLLQATSPLRTADDIDHSIRLCVEKNVPSVISVTEVDKTPYWMYRLSEEDHLIPVLDSALAPTRRQDSEPFYVANGAVYVMSIEKFKENKKIFVPTTVGYLMPKRRSIDIDHKDDLLYLTYLLNDATFRNKEDV